MTNLVKFVIFVPFALNPGARTHNFSHFTSNSISFDTPVLLTAIMDYDKIRIDHAAIQ